MSAPSVLVVARDAGAAAALVPVVRRLLDEGASLRPCVVGWGKALAAFEAASLPVLAFPEEPEEDEVAALLAAVGAVAVLTGTSMRAGLDGRFWSAAASAGVPSVALLDHWTNYAERFTVDRPFDRLPSIVAVPDAAAAQALADRGCPRDRVRVTGNPRFDELPAAVAPELRAQARRELGIDAEPRVVVFASEPLERFYGSQLGYTERSASAALLDAVAAVAPDAVVVVKLHPLELAETWRGVATRADGLDVRLLRSYPTTALAAAADVFCGMTSIVLLDAALLGVPTLSIRPGGAEIDFLDAHAELIPSTCSAADVAGALRTALDRGPRASSSARPAAATGAVLALLRGLLAASAG